MVIRLLAASLLLSLSSQVAAKTWDVPSEISTIQAAIDTASSGDTVLVAPGTYYERLRIIGKNVALISNGDPGNTVLSGLGVPKFGDEYTGWSTLFITTWDSTATLIAPIDSTTLVTGFTFEDCGDSTAFGAAIYCDGENCSPHISGNVFQNNLAYYGGAIDVEFYATPRIDNNVFTNNRAIQNGGALSILFASAPTVVANTFCHNIAYGTGFEVGQGGAINVEAYVDSSMLIDSNLIYDNEAEYGSAISVRSGADGTISNNTIVFNRSSTTEPWRAAGIRVYGPTTTAIILNNIIGLNENGWGIEVRDAAVLLDCNDFWQNELGNYYGISPGTNDTSLDPLFCNAPAYDFSLGVSSPCLAVNSGGCGLIGALGVGCSQVVGVITDQTNSHPLKLKAVRVNGGIKLQLEGLDTASDATVQIFDVQGRIVQTGVVQEAQYTWLGNNSSGQRVVRGVYFARVKVKSEVATTSFVLLP